MNKELRVYWAGGYANRLMIQGVSLHLSHMCQLWNNIHLRSTSNWLADSNNEHLMTRRDAAKMDFDDVDRADVVFCCAPFGLGSSAEMSRAMALGKPVILLAPKESHAKNELIYGMFSSNEEFLSNPENRVPKYMGKDLPEHLPSLVDFVSTHRDWNVHVTNLGDAQAALHYINQYLAKGKQS